VNIHKSKNLGLVATALFLAFSATANSSENPATDGIQPLKSCESPTRVFVGHGTSATDTAKLRSLIEAKGHLVVTETDLLYKTNSLKRGDVVYMIDHGNRTNLIGAEAERLNFPASLKVFNKAFPDDDSSPQLINEDALKSIISRLGELDKKRASGKLTPEEKAITLQSMINGIFRSDEVLSSLNVKIAVMFGPRKAIPYHPNEFALEEGYGDEEQNIMTGVNVTGSDLKARVVKHVDAGTKTIGDLGGGHFMSDIGMFAISLVSAINAAELTDSESLNLTEQFISQLPNCKNKN
jgi:hypothetical protein